MTALFDRHEPAHRRCADALRSLHGPLLTTWPAITEAMYLLLRTAGWPGQERLWQALQAGPIKIADLTKEDGSLMTNLMAKYRDLPMDVADASLVAVATREGLARVLTLDRDFEVYRLPGGKRFELLP